MPASAWVLGDQLLDDHPALRAARDLAADGEVRVVMVESAERLAQLPYHRRKLVLVLSAMRHHAEELRAGGVTVDYRSAADFESGLAAHVAEHGVTRLVTMAASEHATRQRQHALAEWLGIDVDVLPNSQFLVETTANLPSPAPGRTVVMETFYRAIRRQLDVLMRPDGGPVGDAWNLDHENRRPIPKDVSIPDRVRFAPDAITRRVIAEVAASPHAHGSADGFDLAVTRADARAALDDFVAHRLADFGRYEDAMTERSDLLFHSHLSPYVNLGLLDPMEMARAAEAAYHAGAAPLNSVEGFVRQTIGWREFMYWQYWRRMPGFHDENAWEAHRPMPRLFWDADTRMRCLRHAVGSVLATGHHHHIERLMLVCNFCLLAGVDPGQVNDWFLTFYVDAYDWVVTPNVIGMGLNADGGKTATKPYVASANYIDKMSDYCRGCAYDRKARTGPDACPFNTLYWNFVIANEERLGRNRRTSRVAINLRRIDVGEREAIQRDAAAFLSTLEPFDGYPDDGPVAAAGRTGPGRRAAQLPLIGVAS